MTRADCDPAELCINGACQLMTRDVGNDPRDTGPGPDSATDAGPASDAGQLCGQECDTELSCELGVYDCSTGEALCVRSGLREEGFICRSAADSCDVDDTCDGVSAGCADDRAAIGSECDGGFCDGRGMCGLCDEGAACTPAPCQEGTIACSETGVPSCVFSNNSADDTMCGETIIGGFGACAWGSDCAESGEQSREVQETLCTAGACSVRARTETMACSRVREGTMCGDRVIGTWSACGYATDCSESAQRSRTITDRMCQSAVCADVPQNDTEACSRDTDGIGCGDVVTGPFGACSFASECVIAGTQSQTITTPACASGSCNPATSTVSQACSRPDTMGDACGSPTYGAWGTCLFLDCDPNNGIRYRSLTSACTTAQTCDPAATGFETEVCTGSVVGSFCTPTPGGFGTCSAPGICVPGII